MPTADPYVLKAQRFLNTTYRNVPGIPAVEENGQPGWPLMYALTRALQHELGITTLSDNFGPATLSALTSKYPDINRTAAPPANVIRIIQSALYCKGYDGGEIDGTYNDRVSASVTRLKTDMGVNAAYPGDGVTPKVFKGLLTMDPYVTADSGDPVVRDIQQWLNGRYVNRQSFFIIACDGTISRELPTALTFGLQYELGMSDDVATGFFGPLTRSDIGKHTLSLGSSGVFVRLFSAAMIMNLRRGVAFTEDFGPLLCTAVSHFQSFVRLPVTGEGDAQTWASLLVSTGDPTRPGTALDCATEITSARAAALTAAGYQIVGRYLSNVPNTTLNKKIQPGELRTITENGMRVFPIYETIGDSADYFSRDQGVADALSAIDRARFYGFRPGTRVYFAVDFDAIESQVTDQVLPYFRGIRRTMDRYGRGYRIGIYGAREVCRRVAAEGLTSGSFLADMSTGYAGNDGFPMPADWAFDQIATVTVGSGDGSIEIDRNVASGLDQGQCDFDTTGEPAIPDVRFDMTLRSALLTDVQTYLTGIGVPESGGSGSGGVNSTTKALTVTLSYDSVTTSVARRLGIRKALIQAPLLWEIRNTDALDQLADDAVRAFYTGGGGLVRKNDSSTGLGQIFAATAIKARDYAVQQGIAAGKILDPANGADLWPVWQKLQDPAYNITTMGLVHLWDAADLTLPRPDLTTSDDNTRQILARYNGTGPAADTYGGNVLGLYQVFEKYNALMRNK